MIDMYVSKYSVKGQRKVSDVWAYIIVGRGEVGAFIKAEAL